MVYWQRSWLLNLWKMKTPRLAEHSWLSMPGKLRNWIFRMARIRENSTEIGIIREEDFSVVMSQAFATYGLSVVTDRALPDARDGLKPVQRRILSVMPLYALRNLLLCVIH